MQTNVLCNAALAASLSCVPALAQAGNEIVFVGSEPIRAAMLAAGAYVFSNSELDRILF